MWNPTSRQTRLRDVRHCASARVGQRVCVAQYFENSLFPSSDATHGVNRANHRMRSRRVAVCSPRITIRARNDGCGPPPVTPVGSGYTGTRETNQSLDPRSTPTNPITNHQSVDATGHWQQPPLCVWESKQRQWGVPAVGFVMISSHFRGYCGERGCNFVNFCEFD
jgi:hypothetical protein